MSRWISVKDELPKIYPWSEGCPTGISDPVEVCGQYPDGEVFVGTMQLRKGGDGTLDNLYWDSYSKHILYWRHIGLLPRDIEIAKIRHSGSIAR